MHTRWMLVASRMVTMEEKGERRGDSSKAEMEVAEGAESIVRTTPDAIIALRDPRCVRPLGLGRHGDGGDSVASEA